MKLKFLADENISRHLVNLLRGQGYHVSWIRERKRGISDLKNYRLRAGRQGELQVPGAGQERRGPGRICRQVHRDRRERAKRPASLSSIFMGVEV